MIVATVAMLASAADLGPDTRAAGYHGDFLTHPGLSGRLGWQIAGPLSWEVEGGGYWHPERMVAVFTRTGPAVRFTGPRGGTWGAFVQFGAQRGTWTVPSYAVEGGEVRRAVLAGDAWWTATAGPELGRTLDGAVLDGWFVRPQVGLRAPTFHGVGIDLAVAGGVRW